jgi:hypothetical protein
MYFHGNETLIHVACQRLGFEPRFRFVKSERELYKWKKELHEERKMRQNETRKSLKERLFERFRTARERQCTVTDGDLRDWALRIANEMNISDCKSLSNVWADY